MSLPHLSFLKVPTLTSNCHFIITAYLTLYIATVVQHYPSEVHLRCAINFFSLLSSIQLNKYTRILLFGWLALGGGYVSELWRRVVTPRHTTLWSGSVSVHKWNLGPGDVAEVKRILIMVWPTLMINEAEYWTDNNKAIFSPWGINHVQKNDEIILQTPRPMQ